MEIIYDNGNRYGINIKPVYEEIIKIYAPDDTLLVETNNQVMVDDIRYQICNNDLKGFYASGDNGIRCSLDKDKEFCLMNKHIETIAKIILSKNEKRTTER